MAHARALVVCTSFLLVLSSAGACSHFDATRRPAPRGTLGEEIVRVFCERMAREAGVVAIPVSAFYAEKHVRTIVRFCFAKTDATLDRALERLEGLVQRR